jgi:phage regulator Rha-like protein
MLDKDLALLYNVETKVLKQQVKRNTDRFPDDFMFELTPDEFKILRSQFVTSTWGGTRYLPMVFTEQGVAMLSSVLNSKQAILVNIQIIRVFTKMRELLATHKDILLKLEQLEKKDIEQDDKIMLVFEYLKQLEQASQLESEQKSRRRIGFNNGK